MYCWDGNDIVAEQTDGEQIKTYIRGINLIAGEFDRVVYYYILNEHGDVTQLWSQSGACKASYEYDTFGVERNPDKEDEYPFQYCEEYLDLETNSYYLRARNYRSVTGRFICEDTIRCVKNQLPNKQEVSDPLSLNLYTYCHNNPVRYTDPTGHLPFLIVAGLVGLAAGAIAGGISSAIQGKFSWEAVAQGAAIRGTIGLTGGAALAYVATGSALASTGAVASGLVFGVSTVGPAGANGFEQARQLLQASSQIDSSPTFTSNSYNVSALFKTQADSITRATGASIEAIKTAILEQGAHTIDPIKVFVRDGMAMIVDGHHRYQAFVELGLSRIPIQYIHENQLKLYTAYDTAKKMLEAAYK